MFHNHLLSFSFLLPSFENYSTHSIVELIWNNIFKHCLMYLIYYLKTVMMIALISFPCLSFISLITWYGIDQCHRPIRSFIIIVVVLQWLSQLENVHYKVKMVDRLVVLLCLTCLHQHTHTHKHKQVNLMIICVCVSVWIYSSFYSFVCKAFFNNLSIFYLFFFFSFLFYFHYKLWSI